MQDQNQSLEKSQTLMQVFERLEEKCNHLREAALMTGQLNDKLNRVEDQPKVVEGGCEKGQTPHHNIVQLFNSIADEMEHQTKTIFSNTDHSMQMIG